MKDETMARWLVCALFPLLACGESGSSSPPPEAPSDGVTPVATPQPETAGTPPTGEAAPAAGASQPETMPETGVAPTQLDGVAPPADGVAPEAGETAQEPGTPETVVPVAEPYAGYLFTYFTGEGTAQGEQIYFALSLGNDPLSWQELNAGQPVLTSSVGMAGVRDPFIIRSPDGGRFYLIATDLKIFGDGNWDRAQRQGSKSIVVWESTDLVTWTDQRLVQVSDDRAGNTWAPEAFYDATIGAYVVFWASKLYAADDPTHAGNTHNRMVKTMTTDFRTFSAPEVWHDPGYSVIDSTVIESGGVFYRFTKDERDAAPNSPCGKFITLETSLSLTDTSWAPLEDCIGQGMISQGEGPLVFKSNTEQKWYLFIDEFGGRGYVPFESTDITSGSWVASPQYSLPARPRHGTVLPISAAEHQRLLQAFAPN